jgi:hypothetical protein
VYFEGVGLLGWLRDEVDRSVITATGDNETKLDDTLRRAGIR